MYEKRSSKILIQSLYITILFLLLLLGSELLFQTDFRFVIKILELTNSPIYFLDAIPLCIIKKISKNLKNPYIL